MVFIRRSSAMTAAAGPPEPDEDLHVTLREPVFLVIRTGESEPLFEDGFGTSTALFRALENVARAGYAIEALIEGHKYLTRAGVRGLNVYLRAGGLRWWKRRDCTSIRLSRHGWADFKQHLGLRFE